MHRRGVRLATGLDGFSIDDDDDALRELRLAYMLHRGRGLEPGLPLGELLRAACQTGREAVAELPETPLTAGAPADLLALDYTTFAGDTVIESSEAAMLAHRATTRHIKRLVVAGREVVRDQHVLGIDLPGIEQELDAQVRAGASEFRSWQQVSGRIRDRMRDFYAAGLHRCE
jgi:cytosine/adenosine deaminase-related metal-dependent hydrolase